MTARRFESLLEQNATDVERVSALIAAQQLATSSALRTLLDEQGGAILGDEVGAGKTYVTFALIAEALLRESDKGAVIFVPKPILQRKWARQLQEYLLVAVRDRAAGAKLARRVVTLDRTLRGDGFIGPQGKRPGKRSIVVTRHDVFSYTMADADRALCLDRWLELRCPARRRPRSWFFKRCGVHPTWAKERWAKWAGVDVLTSSVLRPLDEVWDRRHDRDVDLYDLFRDRVQDVRRLVGRALIPNAALIVVDEAHYLRSTSSQVYGSLMNVLRGRFDALLFLTATPFQLGSYELGNVVEFFRHGRGAQRSSDFDERVARMKAAMSSYIEALDEFWSAWSAVEAGDAEFATKLALSDDTRLDLTSRSAQAAQRFQAGLEEKRELEAALRPFLIRSVRERHHNEVAGLEGDMLALTTSRVPLALVDRMISELLAARKRTHIASALTSACSSWEAMFHASIATDTHPEASRTRALLHQFDDAHALGEHPKVRHTVGVCLDGLDRGEKTVVFVERVQTGDRIRDLVRAELGTWRNEAARERLQTPARFGWPSLRENYLHTVYPNVFGELPPAKTCLALLMTPEARKLWSRVDPEGRDRDYKVEKRFLEHVVFRDLAARGPWRRGVSNPLLRCVEHILDERYILNGLDLRSGSAGEALPVPEHPARDKPRDPNLDFARAYLAYPSPWADSAHVLAKMQPAARAEIIDAAASAIASSHLQREVAAIEADRDPARHFQQVASLLGGDQRWRDRFEALAEFAVDEIAVADEEQAARRLSHLTSALRRGERVQFVHGSVGPDTQQNAVDGFNTPLYPEVLIATELLGEGLDLHRFCRRVIHHDLPWNPAKLEQRTGRIDRIGSLAERLREQSGEGSGTAIDVWLPYMNGTYDETIFLRVMARRREFRCVLGNRPEWEHEGEEDHAVPMAQALVDALQVQLGPKRS